MDYSTCKPVTQFSSKYPNTNYVGPVNLCKDIVAMKNKPETVSMDNEKELLHMTEKQFRALGEENMVKRY